MQSEHASGIARLSDKHPTLSGSEMAELLIPPPQFAGASFGSYRPDRSYPTQALAMHRVREFSDSLRNVSVPRRFFGRSKNQHPQFSGIYLDGGFGVGKTHLLAALWHSAPLPKCYGTFLEFTAIVGALGYREAVTLFRGASLIAIDEFELDDPGDTMIMTRMIAELVASGTKIAATSNTPPLALGEGRFAAADFLREIQALADRFDTIRIEGLDFRRREKVDRARMLSEQELKQRLEVFLAEDKKVTLDSFSDLIRHLSQIHPARYIRLVDHLDVIALSAVSVLNNQADALRFVAFIDRVYDAGIPILATGLPLDQVFPTEMLQGGYRKKYLRALSRMVALTQ